jgi:DNA-binding CsgD family transcriptional regulator
MLEPGAGERTGRGQAERPPRPSTTRRSFGAWLEATLLDVDDRLGFAQSSLVLVLRAPAPKAQRAFAGAARGMGPGTIAEYFAHWADVDPLATEMARTMFDSDGCATVAAMYPDLDPARRRFVDEFLPSIGVADQLSVRLPGNAVSDGYLTVHGATLFSDAERRLLRDRAPALGRQLRSYLPRGLEGELSARESQTAELVSLGLANREIATVLHVGEDTAKRHLYRAMAKLGIRHRTELAVAWMTGRLLALPAIQPSTPPPQSRERQA